MSDSSRHNLYFVAEATYGTTPNTPAMTAIRHTSCSLGVTKQSTTSNELRADRQITEFRHGNRQVGGDIGFELSYGSLDDLLAAAVLGTWSNDVLLPGVTRQPISVLRHFSDLLQADKPYHLFTGVELSKLTLNLAPGAMVTGSFGCVGRDLAFNGTAPAGATLGDPTTTPVLDGFTGELLEAGVALAVVTELSLTLENGIEPRFVLFDDKTLKPSIGRSNLTGQMTCYFENAALLEKFLNETASSLAVTLTDSLGNSYEILVPNIKYNGGQPDVAGQGAITIALPFQAIYDDATTAQLQITRTPGGN